MTDRAWQAIFEAYQIDEHDFDNAPFYISANQIKAVTTQFTATNEREPRILCYQDTRASRPRLFHEQNLFLLPVTNGTYSILRGEGYVDIPQIESEPEEFKPELDFQLDTALTDKTATEYVDYAFAVGIIQHFTQDDSLVMTIRDSIPPTKFSFNVGHFQINVEDVKASIEAGYEGKKQAVLVHANTTSTNNTCIHRLFYPYRHYRHLITKPILTLFLEITNTNYTLHEFEVSDKSNFNSVRATKSTSYSLY